MFKEHCDEFEYGMLIGLIFGTLISAMIMLYICDSHKLLEECQKNIGKHQQCVLKAEVVDQ